MERGDTAESERGAMVRVKQGELIKQPLSNAPGLFHQARRRFIVLKNDRIEWYEDEGKARLGSAPGK